MDRTITRPTEARGANITRAAFGLDRAREELIGVMRELDEAGEQSEAHRMSGDLVASIDDARQALVRGERRFAERAAADDERERQS